MIKRRRRRVRGLGCPCKVGVSKRKCGIRGFRGTAAQHQDIAAREIGLARKALRSGDCVSAMDHAVTARENARWGSGLFERAEADELAAEARKCLKGK